MMNVIALAFLLSYFGAVVVLVPEPHLISADHEQHGFQKVAPSGLLNSAQLASENQPSTMDKMRDTTQEGFHRTAQDVASAKENTKETATDVYHQAKHGVHETASQVKECAGSTVEQVKHGLQDKAREIKEGIQDKAWQLREGVQDKAEQMKETVQETGEKVASYIPGMEDIKQGVQETGEKQASYIPSMEDVKHGVKETSEKVKEGVLETSEKAASYIPSTEDVKKFVPGKEDAASYIPGKETASETMDYMKQKLSETKDSDASSYLLESIDALKRKLEEAKLQASSYMQGQEPDATTYLSYDEIKKKLDEASAYIPRKETAASYIPGMVGLEGIRRGVKEASQDVQDKAQRVSESARDAMQDTGHGLTDTEGYKGKLGGVLQGMRDRLTGGDKTGTRVGQLERKVQELCSWLGGESQTRESKAAPGGVIIDVAATRESFAYLMQSALGAIDRARGMFEKTLEEKMGGEWKEKYGYLADSAKGALEAAKDVFERAIAAAEGSASAVFGPTQRTWSGSGKAGSVSNLKEAAKHHVFPTLRPLLRAIYLATFSAVYGVTLWMTFLSGYLLSRTLPRQQLGLIQSKMFPVYLRLVTGCLALCIILHAALHPWWSADRWEHLQYWNLAVCVGLSLLNMMVVEPRATKMMFERLKFEKEEGRGQSAGDVDDEATKARVEAIEAKFKGYHQMASYVNLATLGGLTWHLWYLANRLAV